jgi:hypothetical protein
MRFLGRCLVCVATAAFVLLAAHTALAQQQMAPPKVGWLAYRNDSPITLVVQASAPGPNNQERKGPPHQMNPREAAWDQVSGSGLKTITVYDAKGQALLREGVNYAGKDLFFSIQADVIVKGKDKIVKVKLVPLPDPRNLPVGGNPNFAPGGFPGMVLPGLNPSMPRPLTPIPSPGGPIIIPGK